MVDDPPPPVSRRSIRERAAGVDASSSAVTNVEFMSLDDEDTQTSTFRVDLTGELVLDTDAALTTSVFSSQPLGEVNATTGRTFHLLALPDGVSGEDIEALAISVWNEAGWVGPGILHLTEGATLEGPWTMDQSAREELGFVEGGLSITSVWLLRCPVTRGSKPTPEIMRIDEWAAAFPDGVPVGVEYRTLQVLRRIARRLGCQLRLAGKGKVLAHDQDSAVNLRVYSYAYPPKEYLLNALESFFEGVEVPPGLKEGNGEPYALLVPAGSRSRVVVGVRPSEQAPRALRWEEWARGMVYLTEINWAESLTGRTPTGKLTRSARLERTRVTRTIGEIASILSGLVSKSAVVDEDEFLIPLDELPQAESVRHP